MPDTDETTLESETPEVQDELSSETPTPEVPDPDNEPVAEGAGEETGETTEGISEQETPVVPTAVRPTEDRTEAAETDIPPANPLLVEGFYPKEFRGYAVASDGQDLSDPRFEDPASDEAADYFTKLVAKHGGDEDAANREYDRDVVRYETAKGSYESHITDLEEKASRDSIPAVQQQVNAQGQAIIEGFDSLADGLGKKVIESYHGAAIAKIDEGIQELTRHYQARGLSARRAEARATADLAAEKTLYKDALDLAIANDPVAFAKLVLESAGVKPNSPTSQAKQESTPPRPTPPPMAGGGGRGGQVGDRPIRIVPTAEERATAEAIGVDAVEFAKSHRERFRETANGVGR